MHASRFVRGLADVLGAEHVLTDPDLVASYTRDWTGRYLGTTAAVLRPADTAEVAAVLSLCADEGQPVTPQGGNTGLVGGSVPLRGELVLSLRRLRALGEIDAAAGQVTAGAGVTVGDLQASARAAGWAYGVDLASRDSATVGGTVATNAGGLRVLRYGDTRAQLRGIEAVLGTGSVISHLGGLVKDNTGYDLAGLLCGSEGTLGVVTAARLALVAPAAERVVALLAFATTPAAVSAGQLLRREVASLSAAELFFDAGLALVCRATGSAPPFAAAHRAYLLVEASGAEDPSAGLAAGIAALDGVADVAVAVEPRAMAGLWHYRDAHTEAIQTLGQPHKLDVTLPASLLAAFCEEAPAVVAGVAPHAATWLFGHVADGNVHVNVTGIGPDDPAVDEAVLTRVAELGGSISAEHGIGAQKRSWLALNRSPAELEAFRALKRALDPAGICNPGVLLPAP
jgi:FAD/FMN-containing dehydrogenase